MPRIFSKFDHAFYCVLGILFFSTYAFGKSPEPTESRTNSECVYNLLSFPWQPSDFANGEINAYIVQAVRQYGEQNTYLDFRNALRALRDTNSEKAMGPGMKPYSVYFRKEQAAQIIYNLALLVLNGKVNDNLIRSLQQIAYSSPALLAQQSQLTQ